MDAGLLGRALPKVYWESWESSRGLNAFFPVMSISLVFVGSGRLMLSDAFNCANPLWLEQLGSENPKW